MGKWSFHGQVGVEGVLPHLSWGVEGILSRAGGAWKGSFHSRWGVEGVLPRQVGRGRGPSTGRWGVEGVLPQQVGRGRCPSTHVLPQQVGHAQVGGPSTGRGRGRGPSTGVGGVEGVVPQTGEAWKGSFHTPGHVGGVLPQDRQVGVVVCGVEIRHVARLLFFVCIIPRVSVRVK